MCCGSQALRWLSMASAILWACLSVFGIGGALFLLFGAAPLQSHSFGTYTPSWEDIGPLVLISVVSLIVNLVLLGGCVQYSKDMVFSWIIWKIIALFIFWIWYGYSQLKQYGYIDWKYYGMRECYFCGFHDGDLYLSWAGLSGTAVLLLCMTFVIAFHSKLKKRHRELTDPAYFADVAQPASSMRGSQQLLNQPHQHQYHQHQYHQPHAHQHQQQHAYVQQQQLQQHQQLLNQHEYYRQQQVQAQQQHQIQAQQQQQQQPQLQAQQQQQQQEEQRLHQYQQYPPQQPQQKQSLLEYKF